MFHVRLSEPKTITTEEERLKNRVLTKQERMIDVKGSSETRSAVVVQIATAMPTTVTFAEKKTNVLFRILIW